MAQRRGSSLTVAKTWLNNLNIALGQFSLQHSTTTTFGISMHTVFSITIFHTRVPLFFLPFKGVTLCPAMIVSDKCHMEHFHKNQFMLSIKTTLKTIMAALACGAPVPCGDLDYLFCWSPFDCPIVMISLSVITEL